MRALAAAALLLLVGLGVAGCGGGEPTDEEAIERLFKDFVRTLDDLDGENLATLYSTECANRDRMTAKAVRDWELFVDDVDYKIEGAEVRNLEAGRAEALPLGTMIIVGEENPLPVEDFLPVIKEDGQWKLAACEFTF